MDKRSFVMRFKKKTLHRALALALLSGAAQSALAAIGWTGTVDRVFNNPANWSGGVLPPGAGGENAAVINRSSGNTPLIAEDQDMYSPVWVEIIRSGLLVGYGSGQSGRVDLKLSSASYSIPLNFSSAAEPGLSLPPKDPFWRIGDQAGTGEMLIDLRDSMYGASHGQVSVSGTGLGIGLGNGSTGALTVLGNGKDPGQDGYESRYGVGFHFSQTHSVVGGADSRGPGGKGTLTINGGGLVLATSSNNYDPADLNYLKIGEGVASEGKVDVLNGGKFGSDPVGYGAWMDTDNSTLRPFSFIGVNEGRGSVTVSSGLTAGGARNRANFPSGLSVGSTGGQGTLEVFAGGKSIVTNGTMGSNDSTCAKNDGEPDFPPALLISKDGNSTGTVRVSGAGAELMVSGAMEGSPNVPITVSPDQIGQVQIGTGGALVAADGGIAQIGITRITMVDDSSWPYLHEAETTGGLGTVTVNGEGMVVYGALPGDSAEPPGEVQAALIKLEDADSAVVFNHTGNLSFNRALEGGGAIVQKAGTTEIAASLASAPAPVVDEWDYHTVPACEPWVKNSYPTNQNTFAGSVNVQGGTLVLPASHVLLNTVATAISGGTLMQGGTTQSLGSVNMTGGTLQMTGGTTPGATDVAEATSWTGSGGTVQLDTVLGSDGNPSDRLVIAGAASGATYLQINNFGGSGAATTGNGILVVDMQGNTSANNSFALASPVYDNGFSYTLKKQGDGNWYLVSQRGPSPVPGASQPIPALPLPALALLGGLMAAAGGYLRRRSAAGGK